MILLPVGLESGYVRRVAFDTVLYMLLALGLNVVVGWGGLLDLGYVAFYGIGAYAYAMLSSEPVRHPPAVLRRDPARHRARGGRWLPGGLAVAALERRLPGDRDALLPPALHHASPTNGDDICGHNITGGVNGILRRSIR